MRDARYLMLFLLVGALSLGVVGCSQEESITAPSARGNAQATAAAENDIVDTAIEAKIFTTLVTAVQAADLEEALRGEGPFTVFAPTDEAFANLPEGLVAQLLLPENKSKLQELLLYHVAAGAVYSDDIRWFKFIKTLQGQFLWARKSWSGMIRVNNARVIAGDVMASNGVIHAINTVLIPKGFTLEMDPPEPTKDIVDTAIGAGIFKTLVTALGKAELVDALRGEGPFTVFAPADEAFAKLPPELITALLLPENKEKLQDLLFYHVVAGKVLSSDLSYYQRVPTLEGSNVRIVKWFGNVWVNWSRVTTANVLATNGVIHVINRVLIPGGFSLEAEGTQYNTQSLERLLESKSTEEGPPSEFQLEYLPASD